MNSIKLKEKPSIPEMRKYVRYIVNVLKYEPEAIMDHLSHWDKDEVERAIKEVVRENLKPKPKRYFVSLKEPLEDGALR